MQAIARVLPITVKRVKGHEYLYFAYYDADNQRKKEVYIGPKNSLQAIRKALQYNKEFVDLQQSRINTKYLRINKYLRVLHEKLADDKLVLPS